MNIEQLYRNPKFSAAFTGAKTFKNVVNKQYGIKHKDIEKELRKMDTYTLYKAVRKPRKYVKIISKRINYCYQLDLNDLSSYADENDGYKWIICIIDTFSRFAWVFVSKSKTGKELV